MIRPLPLLAPLAALGLGTGFAQAQSAYLEVEPNGLKTEATPVVCLTAGDSLSGTSTGTSSTAANSAVTSADTFRVKTCPLPLGIYRHELRLVDGNGGTANAATLRGRSQTAGAVNVASDVTFQTASTDAPGDLSAWYGFGRGEEVYYRVTGAAATTLPYAATLSTSAVAPTVVAGSFVPGLVVFNFEGQGHATDTDVHLFDSNLVVLDDASNDDNSVAGGGSGTGFNSRLQRTLAPGTYYLAVGLYQTGTDDDSPADDAFQTGNVMDFPDGVMASSTTGGSDITFRISDVAGNSLQVLAAHAAQKFTLTFFQIRVEVPVTSYCSGDGSGSACPCGNLGAAGNGCANSANAAGANLASSGLPSISADTFTLLGSGMTNSFVRYFQGTNQIRGGGGAVFGDGLRCVSGTVVRLGTKLNLAGASQHPELGDLAISVAGGLFPGDVRNYQGWYRDAATYCTSATYNLTNGLRVVWLP